MSFLKKFWLALALTIGSGVSYTVVGDGVVTAAVLGVTALAWIAMAWLSTRPETLSATPSVAESVRESVFNIVQEVNVFIDEEVEILNESLTQIQGLAKDAVTTLSGSMRSLNHQVQMQSKLLHELAGISTDREPADDDDGLSLGQYVDDSQSVIQYFIDLLDTLDSQRGEIHEGLDKAKGKVVELGLRLGDDSDSGDAKLLISRLKVLLERQVEMLDKSSDWTKQRTDASQAIGRMQATREKLTDMRDVVAMNVEAFSQQSNKDVGEAVRSLQFEDIVTQLVADAQYRLDEMNLLVSALNSRTDHLKIIDDKEEPLGALQVVHEIQADAKERIEKLRAMRQKPVGQSSLDEGSVELF